jgi:hypothetical protein
VALSRAAAAAAVAPSRAAEVAAAMLARVFTICGLALNSLSVWEADVAAAAAAAAAAEAAAATSGCEAMEEKACACV